MSYKTVFDLRSNIEQARSVALGSKRSKLIGTGVDELRGFSTRQVRWFINELCSFGPCKYLEIGTWAGSTLIPAIYKNECEGIGIDNWSQFTPKELGGFDARVELQKNLTKYQLNPTMLSGDCFWESIMKMPLVKDINVFMYDGLHDAEPTQKAIEIYGKLCAQPFILLVDDLELEPSVRIGLSKALMSFRCHDAWELTKAQGFHEGVWVGILESR